MIELETGTTAKLSRSIGMYLGEVWDSLRMKIKRSTPVREFRSARRPRPHPREIEILLGREMQLDDLCPDFEFFSAGSMIR